MKENEDLEKVSRRKFFIERRTEVFNKVMLNYPEGITKGNLEDIKRAVKKEEQRLKRED